MKRAFTLIETLVAIAVLAIAVAGPMYAASRSLLAAQNSKNQLTASHLAQEALEYIRLQRDSRYLAGRQTPGAAWDGFTNSLNSCESSDCVVDAVNSTMTSCASCGALQLTSNKRYTQAGGTPTIFTRTIRVRDVMSTASVVGQEITARVSWNFRGSPYFIEVKDILMPWQPAQ